MGSSAPSRRYEHVRMDSDPAASGPEHADDGMRCLLQALCLDAYRPDIVTCPRGGNLKVRGRSRDPHGISKRLDLGPKGSMESKWKKTWPKLSLTSSSEISGQQDIRMLDDGSIPVWQVSHPECLMSMTPLTSCEQIVGVPFLYLHATRHQAGPCCELFRTLAGSCCVASWQAAGWPTLTIGSAAD